MKAVLTSQSCAARAGWFIGILCLVSIAAGLSGAMATSRRAAPALIAERAMAIPGATGRFDFIEADAAMDRLLASHTGNGTLDVFALGTGALVQKVPVRAAQAVAVDEAGGKYYVTCSAEKRAAVV